MSVCVVVGHQGLKKATLTTRSHAQDAHGGIRTREYNSIAPLKGISKMLLCGVLSWFQQGSNLRIRR